MFEKRREASVARVQCVQGRMTGAEVRGLGRRAVRRTF